MSARERMARTILEALGDEETQQQDWGPAYVSDDSPVSKPLRVVTIDGQVDLIAVVDALMAAGFGDVAEGIEAARDAIMPPLNWNLNPLDGNEYPGTSNVDAVYADVHRELTEEAEKVRTAAHPPLSTTGAESDTPTHTERESAAPRQGEPQ